MTKAIDIESAASAPMESNARGQTMALERKPEQPVGAALPPSEIHPPVTAAQAKIEAVASLTMKAYERAATLQITPEEAARLAADFPDEAFKPGAAGKEHLIYIEHAFLRDRLSEVFGMGQWAIIPRNRWAEEFTTQKGTPGSRVYVEAMLVIRGCFVAEAIGAMEYYPKNESQNYGDAVEGAKTAAFRRCAKELGVGLQAWKKDWCDGWWQRRRGGRDFSKSRNTSQNAPGASGGRSTPAQAVRTPASPPPQTPPATKTQEQTPAKAPQQAIFADEQTRTRMLRSLEEAGLSALALEYYSKVSNPSALLPGETLADLPLQFVPVTRRQYEMLVAKLTDFGNGAEAEHPWAPNPLPPDPKKKKQPETAKAGEIKPPPSVEGAKRKDPEWWRDVIVTVPPAGVKREVYIKTPDTVGSLYDRTKSGDQEAQRRLFGFLNHYEAKPWVGRDGKERPPNQADVTFREALDAFGEWHQKHGKDTQFADPPAGRKDETPQRQ